MTMLYRDEAVVLRTQKLGEADRIITLLTRQHGRVRAVAKGVRKTTSRFGARVEPFMVVDIQLYEGRSLDTVTQVDVIGAYGLQIASDYPRYTAATAMLETAERMTEVEREPAVQQYILLAGGLRSLAAGEHQAALILDAYLLRALAVAGWAPSFVDCARCGEPGPHRAFAVGAGGAVCRSCRPPGAAAPHPDTFALLAALMTGEWPVADASEERRRREASGLVAAYLQWHLERRVRSLRWVERGTGPGVPAAADGRDGAGEGSAVGHDSVVDLTQPPRGDAEFAGWANAHADAAHPDATYPDAAYPAYPDDAHPDAAYPGVVDDLGAR